MKRVSMGLCLGVIVSCALVSTSQASASVELIESCAQRAPIATANEPAQFEVANLDLAEPVGCATIAAIVNEENLSSSQLEVLVLEARAQAEIERIRQCLREDMKIPTLQKNNLQLCLREVWQDALIMRKACTKPELAAQKQQFQNIAELIEEYGVY